MIEMEIGSRKGRRKFAAALLVMMLAVISVMGSTKTAFAETTESLASSSDGDEITTATTSDAVPGDAGWLYGRGGEFIASDSNAVMYTCEGDGIFVSVLFPEGAGLPEGARLSAASVDGENSPERYEEHCEEFSSRWSGDIESLKIYDIGFYTEDDIRVETENAAIVSVSFGETPLSADGGMSVVRFRTDGPELLDMVEAVTYGRAGVADITFRTEGFSDFGFVRSGVLPITGGTGTGWCTMAGAVFLLGAWLLYKYERKRRERRKEACQCP